jgi:hypothetical protein
MPDFAMQKQVFGSLDTSYSKVPTKSKNVKFISVDGINRDYKKRNVCAYNFYKNEYVEDLSFELLNDLYCKSLDLNYFELNRDFIFPLEIYEDFNNLIDKRSNDSLLFFAEKHFLRWYKNVKSKSRYIFCRNGSNKSLKKIKCRFDKKYSEMIQNRMDWLMYQFGNENAISLTLTLNPSNFRNDKVCMWETINILLNEFFDKLRLYFKRRSKLFPKYIRCIESMKGSEKTYFVGRGNPHIHICLFGLKYIPKDVIDRFWPYGFSFINSTAKGQKVRYPIHYVTKYITKTYTENDPDNTLNQSLVWFFNKNSFDHSKGLVWPLYKKGDGSWNCEYVVLLDPLENDFLEMDLIFECEENLYKIPPPITINHALHEGVVN